MSSIALQKTYFIIKFRCYPPKKSIGEMLIRSTTREKTPIFLHVLQLLIIFRLKYRLLSVYWTQERKNYVWNNLVHFLSLLTYKRVVFAANTSPGPDRIGRLKWTTLNDNKRRAGHVTHISLSHVSCIVFAIGFHCYYKHFIIYAQFKDQIKTGEKQPQCSRERAENLEICTKTCIL